MRPQQASHQPKRRLWFPSPAPFFRLTLPLQQPSPEGQTQAACSCPGKLRTPPAPETTERPQPGLVLLLWHPQQSQQAGRPGGRAALEPPSPSSVHSRADSPSSHCSPSPNSHSPPTRGGQVPGSSPASGPNPGSSVKGPGCPHSACGPGTWWEAALGFAAPASPRPDFLCPVPVPGRGKPSSSSSGGEG